jgi:NAD(P)-dependent dehydrogenase (short-subunit alcohol dehydrogenase family)
MLAIRSFPLIPAARVGTAKEIVAAVLYLASDAAKFTTARHWSDQDTQVDTDTPVARHNRLDEVILSTQR